MLAKKDKIKSTYLLNDPYAKQGLSTTNFCCHYIAVQHRRRFLCQWGISFTVSFNCRSVEKIDLLTGCLILLQCSVPFGDLHCQCIFSIFPAGAHQLKCKHTCIDLWSPVFLTINLHWSMQSKSALRDRRIHDFVELWCLVGSGGLDIWVSSTSFQKVISTGLNSLRQKGIFMIHSTKMDWIWSFGC